MTVGELKEILEDYDDKQEVCICAYQLYGSDFTYEIEGVEVNDKYCFHSGTKKNVVTLIEGSQSGIISK